MVRIRRKFVLIMSGVTMFAFLLLYVILNHSIQAEKPVSLETRMHRHDQKIHYLPFPCSSRTVS